MFCCRATCCVDKPRVQQGFTSVKFKLELGRKEKEPMEGFKRGDMVKKRGKVFARNDCILCGLEKVKLQLKASKAELRRIQMGNRM